MGGAVGRRAWGVWQLPGTGTGTGTGMDRSVWKCERNWRIRLIRKAGDGLHYADSVIRSNEIDASVSLFRVRYFSRYCRTSGLIPYRTFFPAFWIQIKFSSQSLFMRQLTVDTDNPRYFPRSFRVRSGFSSSNLKIRQSVSLLIYFNTVFSDSEYLPELSKYRYPLEKHGSALRTTPSSHSLTMESQNFEN